MKKLLGFLYLESTGHFSIKINNHLCFIQKIGLPENKPLQYCNTIKRSLTNRVTLTLKRESENNYHS